MWNPPMALTPEEQKGIVSSPLFFEDIGLTI